MVNSMILNISLLAVIFVGISTHLNASPDNSDREKIEEMSGDEKFEALEASKIAIMDWLEKHNARIVDAQKDFVSSEMDFRNIFRTGKVFTRFEFNPETLVGGGKFKISVVSLVNGPRIDWAISGIKNSEMLDDDSEATANAVASLENAKSNATSTVRSVERERVEIEKLLGEFRELVYSLKRDNEAGKVGWLQRRSLNKTIEWANKSHLYLVFAEDTDDFALTCGWFWFFGVRQYVEIREKESQKYMYCATDEQKCNLKAVCRVTIDERILPE